MKSAAGAIVRHFFSTHRLDNEGSRHQVRVSNERRDDLSETASVCVRNIKRVSIMSVAEANHGAVVHARLIVHVLGRQQ